MEHDRGLPNNWVLRVWFLLAYVFGAIKLQALIDLDRDVVRVAFSHSSFRFSVLLAAINMHANYYYYYYYNY